MRFLAILAYALVVTSSATAQADSSKVGLGMAFSAASPASSITGIGDLFLTIRAGAKLRVEPQVGWHHDAASFVASDPTNPINGEHLTNTVFLLGVGLFGTSPSRDGKTTLYYGPRIGMAWVKSSVIDTTGASLEEKQTDWFVTATLGAEHRISRFSVGGEVGLGYLHVGNPSFTQSGGGFGAAEPKGHSIGTSAGAFIRWYL